MTNDPTTYAEWLGNWRCRRCGRVLGAPPAPSVVGWAVLFEDGHIVVVTCPDCITGAEHAEGEINAMFAELAGMAVAPDGRVTTTEPWPDSTP